MSSVARIVITTFDSSASPKIVPWREHSTRVAGVVLGAADARPTQPAVWHLAGSNHRMLARSVSVFDSAAAAMADATAALESQTDLEPRLVRDANGSALGWFLRRGADPVIACARWYSTDRDRRKSLLAAVEGFVTATIAPVARVSHPQLGRHPRV
ncbi:hypothetical protein [Schumannella sp. 10F1B-5-1]|uniref:hypothetical protein n=1 Tax=Schumannella sp. 10F1B-5-1 TaxID=2590780 RepID=UPI001131017A|nr:hypothetical protein [Schumannella sp. 10F1B-5-1]TPW73635.1 hypothetical protein FJ658_05495 [Schumannella sp. 10F1B-5-1]